MFDVGFWELCLVGLISLLAIGPERLPKAARIAGFWLGKSRQMIATVKQEIQQELREEEMRQLLQEQTGVEEINRLRDDVNTLTDNMNSSVESDIGDAVNQHHDKP